MSMGSVQCSSTVCTGQCDDVSQGGGAMTAQAHKKYLDDADCHSPKKWVVLNEDMVNQQWRMERLTSAIYIFFLKDGGRIYKNKLKRESY